MVILYWDQIITKIFRYEIHDAEKLKAEIEMHIKEVKEAGNRLHPNLGFFDAKLSGIYDVMAIIDSLQQEQTDMGEVSDGYHTFNELY